MARDDAVSSARVTCTFAGTDQGAAIWRFVVRNKFAWASIYVRPFTNPDQTMNGVEVMVNSDHGVFGHSWVSIGENWRSFLSSLDMHYAMHKMAGDRFMTTVRVDTYIERVGESIRQVVEQGVDEVTKCRYEAIEKALTDLYEDDPHPDFYFTKLGELSGEDVALAELSVSHEEVNPQVSQFWERLWVPFAAHVGEMVS